MNVEFNKKFLKDFKVLPDYAQTAFKEIYTQIVNAESLFEVPNCIRMQGSNDLYRIRFGDYRLLLLLYISGDTVEFRRVLPRGQVYKKHVK